MKPCLAFLFMLVLQSASAAAESHQSMESPPPFDNAAEFHLELSVFSLFGEPDFQLAYRPQKSRWIFGYRYMRLEGDFDLFGMPADEDIRTLQGPNIRYLFGDDRGSNFYAEAGLYRFSYELICKIEPGSDRSSRTQINLGGGILFNLSESLKINLGVTVSTQSGEPLDAGACRDENGERGDEAIASIVYFF